MRELESSLVRVNTFVPGLPLIHIHAQQRGEVEEVSEGDGSRG